ncbi:MAG: SAM-dependent DNA methyltransferase, partial [Myxococcales bacterium]|nr:SAM-dependent DNA methyltransferase [Myxococcales bacterium]
DFNQSEYGRVILPLTVLRRFDCVLEDTREAVLAAERSTAGRPARERHARLLAASGAPFYNTSGLTFSRVVDGEAPLGEALRRFIAGFSANAREIIECFRFEARIDFMVDRGLLQPVLRAFSGFDLYPPGHAPPGKRAVSNLEMGYIFEELIRKFAEQSNETAGEHFTPRDAIRLMVNLLFNEDREALRTPGVQRTMYDPACGTGGMLSVAEEYLSELNPQAALDVFGQEINPESYAICRADMMLRGHDAAQIKFGNSFTEDGLADRHFDYCISNPPYGVSWKKYEAEVKREMNQKGFAGRFGAGVPRVSDGSLLFLQHMIAKMRPAEEGGSRIAVVFNASPLFTGPPGSGESEIRRWIIENDWLEAIVALPEQIFYNTGIQTFLWILTNRKHPRRAGKVQLINGTAFCQRMARSLGDKRNEMTAAHIGALTRLHADFVPGEHVRIFDDLEFGFRRVLIQRPLRCNFAVDAERLDRLRQSAQWTALTRGRRSDDAPDPEREAAVLAALAELGEQVWFNRPDFQRALGAALAKHGISLTGTLRKALVQALAQPDPRGEVCRDRKGEPESDPAQRDTEDVPLAAPLGAWIAREVLPYAPDAWAEPEKAHVGYQINVDRVFHTYQDPRPVAAIAEDLRALEARALRLLDEILA